jgi:hypothetical protein
MGRWSSDAFMLYLQDYVIILAPYIQASPALKLFIYYTWMSDNGYDIDPIQQYQD